MPTIAEIDAMITEMHTLEESATAHKRQASEYQEKADEVRARVMAALKESGVSSFKGTVGSVSIAERFAVKLPADPDLRDELREYLVEKGAFDALWSVNYQSLNSWYKVEMEQAKERGEYLDVPGLEPKMDTYLQFRKASR